MLKIILLALLTASVILNAQANVWTKIPGPSNGTAGYSRMIYSPATDEYVINFGPLSQEGINSRYQVQVFTHDLGAWINALPHDSLYGSAAVNDSLDAVLGNWADSTGFAYGNGRVGMPVFRTYSWTWGRVNGYLRPSSVLENAKAYGQGCLNTDNGKFYFYLNNQTISYDPATRLFDTISVAVHPNSGGVDGTLRWGSLVYDALNHEILLFGGGALDQPYGSPMTWTFNPTTHIWTKRNPAVQPGPRAHAPMVYDPVHQVVVMFGGDHLDYIMNDTWVYHCATRTWEKKMPAISPKPRAGHGFYYLPKQGKIALMGGYRYAANQQTEFEIWTYDVALNTWGMVKRFATGDVRPLHTLLTASMYYLSACDTADNILAIADEAPSWQFYPSTYRMPCDVSVIDAAGTATYGMKSDTLFYSGSYYETSFGIANDPAWFTAGVPAPDTAANEAFLRTLPVATWVEITQPKLAGGHRDWGTAILDTDRGNILVWSGGHVAHCGTDVPQYSIADNRWTMGYRPEYPLEYDGNNFPAPGPFTFTNRPFMPCHSVKSYAYDVNLHKMVFAYDYHTWLYDPAKDWDSVNIHNPWGGGWGYNSGLISTPHGVFNWFGNGNKPSTPYLFDTTLMNWRALPRTGTFPGFYADDNGVVYDSKRDRVLWFSRTAMYAYSFGDNRCVQLNPSDTGIKSAALIHAGYLREGIYLPNQDIVLFTHSSGINGDLAYDCTADRFFVVRPSGTSFEGGVASGFMYDGKRNLVWHRDNYRDKLFVIRFEGTLGIAEGNPEVNASAGLSISPNPFNPMVTIRLSAALKGASLKVFDMSGRLVADLSDRVKTGAVEWNASSQASGVYLVMAEKGTLVSNTKIVLGK